MSREYYTHVTPSGTRLQSGIPKRGHTATPGRAYSHLLRGAVTATYVLDDENHPFAGDDTRVPVAVYCDVMIYGRQWQFLRNVLVAQDRGGMHSGRVWKPRAATLDRTENEMDLNARTNPANLDGDHVLIAFIDGNFNQPVIIAGLQHPSADTGNEERDAGHRMRLKLADGDPDFWKHRGAYYGISGDGDFVLDLTRAWAGNSLENDGKEPNPVGDGSTGNYVVRMPVGATVAFELGTGELLALTDKDGNATLKLGDGAKSAIIAEAWETFWNNFASTIFNLHVHQTPVGPTVGPPSPTAANFPSNAISTKVTIPDG